MIDQTAQHRLMVLGSMDEFIALVKKAKKRRYFVVVCDGYKDGPAKKFADRVYDIDVREINKIAQVCKDENIDGIITSFSDLLAECMIKIADKANISSYCTPQKFEYLRNKMLMKTMFERLSVPSARPLFLNKKNLNEHIEDIKFPVICKQLKGYGSHGVVIVENKEELISYFDGINDNDSIILVEELYSGHEFNMMTMIVDGKPQLISVADRETSIEQGETLPHVSRIVYPSRIQKNVEKQALEIIKKVATYVGINDGPISMQFFWNKDDGIKVCEIAGRFFGYEHELVEMMCGLSMEELLLDLVYSPNNLSIRINNSKVIQNKVSFGLYFHGHEGAISSIEGVPKAKTNSEINSVLEYYQPGETIGRNIGDKPYAIRIYCQTPEYEIADTLSNELFSSIKCLDAEGNNLLFSNQVAKY